jgi:hypothetical protein
MGLFRKIFGGQAETPTQFHESDGSTSGPGEGNAPRREVVHVVLRDVMRKHGIPSDWIECRILSGLTRQQKAGIHVQFIVLKGEAQLLDYVHAFQDSFWREVEKYEPRARDWLFSVAWQFEGNARADLADMPRFEGWDEDTQVPPDAHPSEQDTQPHADHEEDLRSDLARLYAIRDAAMDDPAAPPSKGKSGR